MGSDCASAAAWSVIIQPWLDVCSCAADRNAADQEADLYLQNAFEQLTRVDSACTRQLMQV